MEIRFGLTAHAFVDFFLAAVMCYYLQIGRTGFSAYAFLFPQKACFCWSMSSCNRMDGTVVKLMQYVVSSGLATAWSSFLSACPLTALLTPDCNSICAVATIVTVSCAIKMMLILPLLMSGTFRRPYHPVALYGQVNFLSNESDAKYTQLDARTVFYYPLPKLYINSFLALYVESPLRQQLNSLISPAVWMHDKISVEGWKNHHHRRLSLISTLRAPQVVLETRSNQHRHATTTTTKWACYLNTRSSPLIIDILLQDCRPLENLNDAASSEGSSKDNKAELSAPLAEWTIYDCLCWSIYISLFM